MAKIMTDLVLKLSANVAELTKGLEQANSSIKKTQKNTENMGSDMSKNLIAGFTKLGLLIGGTAGAMKGLEAIVRSSDGTADALERTLGGLSLTTQKLMQNIATGDFSNFIKGLKDAWQAGKDVADMIDNIERKQLAGQYQEAIKTPILKTLETTFRDPQIRKNDPKRAQDALDEYKRIKKELAKVNLEVKQDLAASATLTLQGLGIDTNELELLYRHYGDLEDVILEVEKRENELNVLNKKINGFSLNPVETSLWEMISGKKKTYEQQVQEIEDGYKVTSRFGEKMRAVRAVLQNVGTTDFTKYVTPFIKSLGDVEIAKGAIIDVDNDMLKIESSLTNNIEKQTKATDEQKEANDRLAQSWLDISRAMYFKRYKETPLFSQKDIFKTLGTDFNKSLKIKPFDFKPSLPTPLETAASTKAVSDELERQQDLVSLLEGSFINMFDSIDQGFKGMLDSIIQSIKRLASEILAKAAVWAIMAVLFPESAAFKAMGSFGSSVFGAFKPSAAMAPTIPTGAMNNLTTPLSSGQVVFRIDGTQLVGVLNNQSRKSLSFG